ncbi:MAG: divergent polysaccharide deacetylase family protein [Kiloniellaceae bacterium]
MRRARRRAVAVIAGLGVVFTLLGGLGGAYMALRSAPDAPYPPQVALSLPAPEENPQAAAPTVRAPAKPTVAPDAREEILARLYEEPVEPAPAPKAERRAGPRRATMDEVQLALMRLPAVSPPVRPQWQRNAVAVSVPPGRPMIAVVLDDLGLNREGAWRAIALPPPVTLSFMTYAEGLERFARNGRAAGHELLLHVPMEPRSKSYNPGPNVLLTDLPPEELLRRLEWALGRFHGFVGINNHMGSKFTASAQGVAYVMRKLKARGLLFLDSMTSRDSVGWLAAQRAGVPYARRDVFLDNDWRDPASIRRQLARLEAIARRQGYAVGIGHPHRATLDVLARWLPRARRRGFALVPLSAIVRHQIEIANKVTGAAG